MEKTERDQRLLDHCNEYDIALDASQDPDYIDALEIFVASLENKPLDIAPHLHPLFVFFRSQLAKNIPLNWFCGEDVLHLFTSEDQKTIEFEEKLGGFEKIIRSLINAVEKTEKEDEED